MTKKALFLVILSAAVIFTPTPLGGLFLLPVYAVIFNPRKLWAGLFSPILFVKNIVLISQILIITNQAVKNLAAINKKDIY